MLWRMLEYSCNWWPAWIVTVSLGGVTDLLENTRLTGPGITEPSKTDDFAVDVAAVFFVVIWNGSRRHGPPSRDRWSYASTRECGTAKASMA